MRIFKTIAGIFFVALGVIFVVISVRVIIWPPKEGTGIDIVFLSLLLSIMPFLLGAWLLKDFVGNRHFHGEEPQ